MSAVAVTGSATFEDWELVNEYLLTVETVFGLDVLVTGGVAEGAQMLAARWGSGRGVQLVTYEPNYEMYQTAAEGIRNSAILQETQPDLVVAFVETPLSNHTDAVNLVAKARIAGVRVVVIGEDDTFEPVAGGDTAVGT